MGKNRRRIVALVGAAAVAGVLLAVAPAFGDSHPDAVRLHLGSDGQYFEYENIRQNLTSTRCEINELDGPLMTLDANRKVGLNSFGIGVKSGGAQGIPCGRVDITEDLTLSVPTGEGPLKGRFFDGVQLDLELKGNARVIATLYNDTAFRVFELGSGSSVEVGDMSAETDDDGYFWAISTDTQPNVACGLESDSGPDAGPLDNCLWTIDTAFQFNRIVLTAEVGEFSLEGSGDYGDNPAFDSLFFIANTPPIALDDAVSTDEDTSISTPTNFDVLTNDTDADGDTLKVTAINTTRTTGTVTLDGSGNITYDPNGKFETLNVGASATDSFLYTISDGKGGSDTANVTVTVTGVNDAPVVGGSFEFDEDEAKVLQVATDIDDDVLGVSCVIPNLLDAGGNPIPVLDDFGEPVFDGDDPVYVKIGTYEDNGDGRITFTPAPDYFTGAEGITVSCTATDPGKLSDTQNITVVIRPVPDDPTAVRDEAYTDGSTPVWIDVLSNDYDVDGDAIRILSVDIPTVGTASLGTHEGTQQILFTPRSGFTGSASFTYTITDDTCVDGTETCAESDLRTDFTTVTIYELFKCGETLGLRQHGVTANYTRLFPVGGSGCDDDGKPYDLSIDNSDPAKPVVVFVPRSIGEPLDCSLVECPRFSAELIFPPRPATPGLSNTGTLQWYPDATVGSPGPEAWIDMPWCLSSEVGMVGVQRAVLNAELPTGSGEGWCIGFVETRPAVEGDFEVGHIFPEGFGVEDFTVTTWFVYGIGDPLKRVS